MSEQAPVCNIPSTVHIKLPGAARLPSIPAPQMNLASLVNTVNTIKLVVELLSGQKPLTPVNNFTSVSFGSSNTLIPSALNAKIPQLPSRFFEIGRITKKVRIFQNGDENSNNWVDVQRIQSLTLMDKVTGETWPWHL